MTPVDARPRSMTAHQNPQVRPHTAFARLLRLAAAWLAAALLMQSLQGAMALGAGPRHTHQTLAQGGAPHGHLHTGLERHHHRMDDASVLRSTSSDDSLDAASLALTLALALMVLGRAANRLATPGRVLCASAAWFWSDRTPQPLRRPPRAT
jgi:hypothetical protein